MRCKSLFALLVALLWIAPQEADSAEITQLTTGDDYQQILVQGSLVAGDEDKFVATVLPLKRALIILDSPGGNLLAGIEIGKAIRLKGFFTVVGQGTECASACALAWLGGKRRFMEEGAKIGFHAAYELQNGVPDDSSAGNALVGAYLHHLGLGPEAIIFITTTDPTSMVWLTSADANELGLDVTVWAESPTSGPQPKPAVSVNWLIKDGIDLFGFDIVEASRKAGTASECEMQCRAHSGCLAFTFNIGTSTCFLKSNAEKIYRNAKAISGYQASLEQGLRQSSFTIEEGTDRPGFDFQQLRKTSFAACLQACEDHPGCMAFSYIARRKQCWLKSASGKKTLRAGITSGVREPAE